MSKLYSSPLRVYLLLGALALVGIYSGFRLPVSLFPNSSKPFVSVYIAYGSMTAEEFLNTYGKRLEEQLRNMNAEKVEVERIESTYGPGGAFYDLHFKWGVVTNAALKEVQTVVNSFAARLPQESRDSVNVDVNSENAGFFALSFYSETRDIDRLYDYLEPMLGPRINRVKDAQNPVIYNPSSKEVRVELIPETLASLQLFPGDVDNAILSALGGRSGGAITVGTTQLAIEMPRQLRTVDELSEVSVPTPSGKAVHLGDIARINLGPKSTDNQIFKTNGAPSLILYATPKPGGNVKRMSEELMDVVRELAPSFPPDIKYRSLVDPSEFIRSAVNNVFHEVGIAAMLAVAVLFLFIGSFRNVVTAAIEIPMSMVLAFILMRLSGMNLNLISLGGLALSAGMNVDASVVVMENIFRHFEATPGPHDFASRLRIVTEAVSEVRFAVIASTIASLVVFLPLTFTSDLSYAILGDLALAVVFSHGFSAFVALLLVPTVRLQLMAGGQDSGHTHSPVERQLKWLESTYGRLLSRFIAHPRLKWGVYGGLGMLLFLLVSFVLPRLPKEIVGTPDTDWLVLGVSTNGNTLVKQMEVQTEEVERNLLKDFHDKIQYTFSIVRGTNSSTIMARIKDKAEMRNVWKAMEKRFPNTPLTYFWVGPWNPSELPIPNPPDMRIAVRGGTLHERARTAKELSDLLQENKIYPRVMTKPNADIGDTLYLSPHIEQWTALRNQGARFSPADLADLVRVASTGRRAGYFPYKSSLIDIILRFPHGELNNVEDVAALPVGVGPKIVPLKALVEISRRESTPTIYREDERDVFLVTAREGQDTGVRSDGAALARAKRLVAEWEAKRMKPKPGQTLPSPVFEDAAKDLTEAIHQLSFAVALSVLLIFLTMLIQFGSFVEPLLVLISIPLGFIGVLVSLFVFRSTLSLNSILGVILLNGIAVANSIILVDFIKRLVDRGRTPREAAVEAARTRLRPILITSLTTVLGMLPVAIGAGEGGRILQPLGIAVSGGLWVSMGLTLFLVPALQVSYLEWRNSRDGRFGRWLATAIEWLDLSRLVRALRRPEAVAHCKPYLFLCLLAAPAVLAEEVTPPLGFDTALARIVERSTGVATAQASAEGIRGKNLSTHLTLLPSLSLSATQTYSPTLSTPPQRGILATLNFNLFKFGADLNAMSAANAEEDAADSAITDGILKAQTEGVAALVAYIQAEQETAVQAKVMTMWDDTLRIARARYDRGLMASQEVDKVAVDRDNNQAQARDTESDLIKARADLKALLGENRVAVDWPWKKILLGPSRFPLNATDTVLSRRPDWMTAEKNLTAAERRASAALGSIFPTLDLSLSYNYGETIYGGIVLPVGPPVGGSTWNGYWTGMVGLTIPLFDRLANYGSYRGAIATRKTQEIAFERVKRQARAEYEAASGSLQVSLRTAQAREETLNISRRLYEANLKRFNQGLANANDLNVDQERLYRSELFAIRGWGAAHANFARLCNSLGQRVEDCLHAR